MAAIAAEGCGVVVYAPGDEGRGIGIANKIAAYALQDEGADTVDANVKLGLPVDARDFALAIGVLQALSIRSVRLLTNSPAKVQAVRDAGIVVSARVPCRGSTTPSNVRYLETKRARMGHHLSGTA